MVLEKDNNCRPVILVQVTSYYYVYHIPVEECTSSPDVRKYCTHDHDVYRCPLPARTVYACGIFNFL